MSTKSVKIFFFGDSICFGQGISLHHGWIPKIAIQLSEIGTNFDHEVVVTNAGVNGNTTRQALERMPYDIQSAEPDALIIQFGMNDCNYWQTDRGGPRVSPAAFCANLHEIIDRAFRFGASKIFLHTNHPTTRSEEIFPDTSTTYQKSNELFNQYIRNVAEQRNDPRVKLIDIEKSIFASTQHESEKIGELLLEDKLHLSKKGHDYYFNLVNPILADWLTEKLEAEAKSLV